MTLFEQGERVISKRKRSQMHTNIKELTVLIHRHVLVHRARKGDCVNCKGKRHGDPPRKRVALGQIAANLGRSSRSKSSVYECI